MVSWDSGGLRYEYRRATISLLSMRMRSMAMESLPILK